MRPFEQNGYWIIVCALVWSLTPQDGCAREINLAPSRHPDFSIVEYGDDYIRVQYVRPDVPFNFRETASIYLGIPAEATHQLSVVSWVVSFADSSQQTIEVDSDQLVTAQEQAAYRSILTAALNQKVFSFQEIDVVRVQIPSQYNPPKTEEMSAYAGRTLTFNQLVFDIRWTAGENQPPEIVSSLDAGYNRLLKTLCINGEILDKIRRKRTISDTEKVEGFNPAVVGYRPEGKLINLGQGFAPARNDAVRVIIRESGITAVGPDDLKREGISLERVNLEQVRVWHAGQEIPALVQENGDGIFNQDDRLIFYAYESSSEFTNNAQYFITWHSESDPPKRIETHEMAWSESGDSNIVVCKRYNQAQILVKESADRFDWYVLDMDKQTKTWILDLPGLAPEGDAQIHFQTLNNTRRDCSFTAQIGSVTQEFSLPLQAGANLKTVVFSVPASELVNSPTLTLILDQEPYEVPLSRQSTSEKVYDILRLFIKQIEVVYQRKADIQDTLTIEREWLETGQFSIALKSGREKRPFSMWLIGPDHQVVRYRAEQWDARPAIQVPDSSWQRIEILPEDQIPGPFTVDRDFPSTLHRVDQGYHIVILAPRIMIQSARPLVEWRTRQGFQVLLEDIQNVYDEFNHGYPSYDAITRFLRYTQSEWNGLSPDFVVFIGDSNWDHRDREGTGAPDQIPTYAPIDNPQDYPTDEWYAYLWGKADDYMPDVILGRISVQTVDDLDQYIDKIYTYEHQTPVGPWKATNVFINDDGPFTRYAVSNTQSDLPAAYHPVMINQTDFPHVTNPYLYHRFMNNPDPGAEEYRNKKMSPECTLAILDQFNQGALVMQYIGHGGNQLWSGERIFYGTNRPYSNVLELKPNTKFPFILSWSCLTGYLNFNLPPFNVCLAEELIRYRDRGAIAVWGPSGNGTTNLHMILSRILMRSLTEDGLTRLGEAATYTKAEFMENTYNPALVNQYVLFGDPTIQLALPSETLEVQVEPGYCIENRQQEMTLATRSDRIETGQAIVSLTIAGENIYESTPFEFENGIIEHRLDYFLKTVEHATASIRVYIWDEKTQQDAWGGIRIPKINPGVMLSEGSVKWNGDEAEIEVKLANRSIVPLQGVTCRLLLGGQEEYATIETIPGDATAAFQWKGQIPDEVSCAYVYLIADPKQGIRWSDASFPLVVPLRMPQNSPIVPLLGKATFSVNDLIAKSNVRYQVPIWNMSETETVTVSATLLGPGVADEVQSATLTAGQEQRLNFPIALPEAGDYEYVLKVNQSEQEQSYTIPVNVQGLPDLALAEGDFEIEPNPPVVGHTVYLKLNVWNVGEGPAKNVVIKAFDGDPSLRRELTPFHSRQPVQIDRIEPGEQAEVTLVWDPPAYEGVGSHEINIVVDPQERIEELSRLNNRLTLTLNMSDLPDLEVDKWNNHWMETVVHDAIPLWGQPLKLFGKMRNSGDADAKYVRFTFQHNEEELTHFFDVVAKGSWAETSFEVPLLSSKNLLTIYADRYDLIGEKNETSDLGNNVSSTKRLDFQLRMPEADIVGNKRVYYVTDSIHFDAGMGEYLIFDKKRDHLLMHPDIELKRIRLVPGLLVREHENNYYQAAPTNKWQWNARYNSFYSPTQADLPLRFEIPAPNGVYDVYIQLYSNSYAQQKSEKIKVKPAQAPDVITIDHQDRGTGDFMWKIGTYTIRNDLFTVEFTPVPGGGSTSIADIQFVRSDRESPISTGYLSPYFPATGSGIGPALMTWEAEVPEGAEMNVKARWVFQQEDGSLRFTPWARIVKGEEGRLQLPGKGNFFQYYVEFIRQRKGSDTALLSDITITIPCKP